VGVLVSDSATKKWATELVAALAVHRHWERAEPHPTRDLIGS
jgi:hypothetical protein